MNRDIAIYCKHFVNLVYVIDVQYIHLKINSKIPFNIIYVYRPPNCNEIYNEHIYVNYLIYKILIHL